MCTSIATSRPGSFSPRPCARAARARKSSRRTRSSSSGGVALTASAQPDRLTTSYSPPLLPAGEFSSHGGQTLLLEPQRGVCLEGGVNVFRTRHFGFQIAASRTTSDLDGTNGPYSTMDSCGIGVLVDLYRSLRQRGGHLKLVCPSDRCRHVLALTQLLTVFDPYESEDAALRTLHESVAARSKCNACAPNSSRANGQCPCMHESAGADPR